MRAIRSLYVCKTLRLISDQNRNLIITCCRYRDYPQLPKKIHSTPQPRFPSSTAANESTAPTWSAFPISTPTPTPVESPSRETPAVQAAYDPTTGGVVIKREHNGSKELDSGTAKTENISSTEMGNKVYADVIGSSSVRSSTKKGKTRSVHVCSNCGYSDGQWWGTCKQCGEVGTMKLFTTENAEQKTRGMQVSENAVRSWFQKETAPIKLTDVYSRVSDTKWRISL